MADLEIGIDLVGETSEIAVVGAKGYIDTVTAPDLEKELLGLMDRKVYKLIINLKNVSYISSAGWGIFVSELRDIRENGGDLVLVEMSPDVYDVYELMEFSSILKSFDVLDDAFKNFGFVSLDPATVPADQKAAAVSPAVESAAPSAEADAPAASSGLVSTQDKILDIVKNNPYYEEKQIRAELSSAKYDTKVGFFEIKKLLKELGLDDSKKRFDYAMKNK